VVYPVEHDPGWLASAPQPSGGRALSNLLGDTRAALLHATQGGRSTTNLARHLGVSAATISYHTTILRETGLITSQRLANTMIHTLSPLGTALFRGQQPKERPEDPA
jgi:DNA-binding transcriptional ArsR family regulator